MRYTPRTCPFCKGIAFVCRDTDLHIINEQKILHRIEYRCLCCDERFAEQIHAEADE